MSVAAARGSALVLWYGGKLVMAGTMKIGELVGFLFFLALFYEPVARLHGLNQMLQAARAAGERVFDILDAPLERDRVLSASRPSDSQCKTVHAQSIKEPSHEPVRARAAPAAPWKAAGEVRYQNV